MGSLATRGTLIGRLRVSWQYIVACEIPNAFVEESQARLMMMLLPLTLPFIV